MYAQQDQDSIPAVPQSLFGDQPRAAAHRRRRAAGAALAASAWAATLAAALFGGHPGHGATAQIAFAAIMATFATGETLFSPASPGAAGRYSRLSTWAFIAGCVLALAVGARGAGWGTSLLTTLAVACAIASSAVRRPGRQRPGRSSSTGVPSADNDANPSPWPGTEPATTRGESFAERVGSGV
jgi:hypothetical protein